MITASGSLDLVTLMGVCILGAVSPGPSVLVILGVSAQSGVRAGVVASWAHAGGVGLWALVSLCGWQVMILAEPMIAQGLSIMAAIYLVYLAIRLSQSHSTSSQVDIVTQKKEVSIYQSALAGLSISLSNPKLLLFFSAIYPQVIPQKISEEEFVLALFIPILIDGLWYHFLSWTSARFGFLRLVYKYQKVTMMITAIIFVMIAIRTLAMTLHINLL